MPSDARAAAFLGRGWGFPPAFDAAGGGVAMVSSEEDVRQSLWIILSTEPGERPLQPRFGCPLRQFAFRRLDLTLRTRIKDTVFQALLHWEPRVIVGEIQVDDRASPEGIVRIGVPYRIRATNNRFNLVFPYYLAEGSARALPPPPADREPSAAPATAPATSDDAAVEPERSQR